MCLLRKNLNCLSSIAKQLQPIRFLNYCNFKGNLLTFWICDFQIWKTSIPFVLNCFHFRWQPCDSHPNHRTRPSITIQIYMMAEPKEHFNSLLRGWDVAGRLSSVTSSYKLKWEPFSHSGMDGNGPLKAVGFTYGVWHPGATRIKTPNHNEPLQEKDFIVSTGLPYILHPISLAALSRKACRKARSSVAVSAQTSVWASYLRRHPGSPAGL